MKDSVVKPCILVTNDDGIDSPFLRLLVRALKSRFDVRVVAPLTEQSWIGKAMSRHKRVNVRRQDLEEVPSWSVDGTPADCVNIALGHLFDGEAIAAVVSGVNIGYNASLSTVLSSGTVGAALEAALMGVPAVALSKALPQEWFQLLQQNRSELPVKLESSLLNDVTRVISYIEQAVSYHEQRRGRTVVHNYNFPHNSNESTETHLTHLAQTRGVGIFTAADAEGLAYEFKYRKGENIDFRTKTDLNCLTEGHISYTLIDFTDLTHL